MIHKDLGRANMIQDTDFSQCGLRANLLFTESWDLGIGGDCRVEVVWPFTLFRHSGHSIPDKCHQALAWIF
jgi:hypothetical protein